MGTFVSLVEVRLHFGESHDLKGKRKQLHSIKAGLRQRFGASVAEIDGHDTWQRAGLDTNYYVMPTAQSREAVNRHTFSGLGNGRPVTFSADQIGTAEKFQNDGYFAPR